MTTAVLLMAYGTPSSPDEIEAYYTHIRRGRPPTAEQLDDLVRRYDAIGGLSPLAVRTEGQRAGLQAALDARAPGEFDVVLGFKHADPFIEDVVASVAADRIVALVLAPHYSELSVGEYLERARTAAGATPFTAIESWATEPAYVEFLTAALRSTLAAMPEGSQVLFTAHSLPERAGPRYADDLRATAHAVAHGAQLRPWAGWAIGWQSAGRTPEPWLGPDVREVIADLAATGRAKGLVVCPCGFVSDHLEILYDLDIEAAATAAEVGLPFARTPVMNDDPAVLGALADRIVAA